MLPQTRKTQGTHKLQDFGALLLGCHKISGPEFLSFKTMKVFLVVVLRHYAEGSLIQLSRGKEYTP